MKKLKLILLLTLLTFIGTLQVGATDQVDHGGDLFRVVELFTICNKVGRNCITVDTDTINNNQKYDLFEIKDKEIYLDNSEITLEILRPIEQQYIIHISGTNKIEYLNNLVKKVFIPFTVVGDGTLEIVTSNQIKKNSQNELYYKNWILKVYDFGCDAAMEASKVSRKNTAGINENSFHLLKRAVSKKSELEDLIACLTEAEVNTSDNTVTFKVPKYGYTASDLKNKFAENADAFYNAYVNSTITMQEFEKVRLLKSYAGKNDNVLTADGRRAFIDKLIQNGKTDSEAAALPSCGTPYLVPSNPATEEAQITAAWGEEYIKTDLRRSFSNDGHYLINFPEEKNMITTTKKDNIVFESTEEFDPNYHLVVDDITEKITDIQSASVQAKTDKTLVELYDIYMADENDNIVKMENGTYKIKVELNDTLKKYEGYEIIYISEDNKVELIDATVEGNYIAFNTTHLSKYGVVGTEIKKTGNIITNPKTADSVVTYGLALGALAVAVALVVLRIRKLKNN